MPRKLAGLPILLATAFAATGWLYVLRPALPGPKLGEALPLDELAKHSSAPLVWFVAIWLAAALTLGLYARYARLERLTAALLIGVGIGLFGYLQTGVSIAVVRQIPLRDALDSAAGCKPSICPLRWWRSPSRRSLPRAAAAVARRSSWRRSSPWERCSTSYTRSCRATTRAFSTRSRPTPSDRSRAQPVLSRESRCSLRPVVSRGAGGGPGRSRSRLPERRRHCTSSTGSITARWHRRSFSSSSSRGATTSTGRATHRRVAGSRAGSPS